MRTLGTDCLLLSASRRTFDACLSEVVSHFGRQQSPRAFCDALLTAVEFQEGIIWSETKATEFIALGYINGVQILGVSSSVQGGTTNSFYHPVLDTNIPIAAIPNTMRLAAFRTAVPVTALQLFSDIPGSQDTLKWRLAVGQEALDGTHVVAVISCFKSITIPAVHVLRLNAPVLKIATSLSWVNDSWHSTLILATHGEIRVIDGTTLQLRYLISDCQVVRQPPFWRWLTSTPIVAQTQTQPSSLIADGTDEANPWPSAVAAKAAPLKTAPITPVFAVGSRLLVYQQIARIRGDRHHQSQSDDDVNDEDDQDDHLTSPRQLASSLARRFLRSGPRMARFSQRFLKAFNVRQEQPFLPVVLVPQDTSEEEDIQYSSDGTNPSNEGVEVRTRRVSRSRVSHRRVRKRRRVTNLRTIAVSGPILMLDILTGDVVGHVQLSAEPKPSTPSLFNYLTTRRKQDEFPAKVTELADGAWTVSHIHNTTGDYENTTDVPPVVPGVSLLEFDRSGSTLFCGDWTGRSIWAIRFAAEASGRLLGVPLYEMKRGGTVGQLCDVASASFLPLTETPVAVATARGTIHIFPLPAGFHMSCISPMKSSSIHTKGSSPVFVTEERCPKCHRLQLKGDSCLAQAIDFYLGDDDCPLGSSIFCHMCRSIRRSSVHITYPVMCPRQTPPIINNGSVNHLTESESSSSGCDGISGGSIKKKAAGSSISVSPLMLYDRDDLKPFRAYVDKKKIKQIYTSCVIRLAPLVSGAHHPSSSLQAKRDHRHISPYFFRLMSPTAPLMPMTYREPSGPLHHRLTRRIIRRQKRKGGATSVTTQLLAAASSPGKLTTAYSLPLLAGGSDGVVDFCLLEYKPSSGRTVLKGEEPTWLLPAHLQGASVVNTVSSRDLCLGHGTGAATDATSSSADNSQTQATNWALECEITTCRRQKGPPLIYEQTQATGLQYYIYRDGNLISSEAENWNLSTRCSNGFISSYSGSSAIREALVIPAEPPKADQNTINENPPGDVKMICWSRSADEQYVTSSNVMSLSCGGSYALVEASPGPF